MSEQVNTEVTEAGFHYYGYPIDRLLYDMVITVLAYDANAPMVSAVVHYSDRNNPVPGRGFWQLASELRSRGWTPGWTPPHTGADAAELLVVWALQEDACYRLFDDGQANRFQTWLRRNEVSVYEQEVDSGRQSG